MLIDLIVVYFPPKELDLGFVDFFFNFIDFFAIVAIISLLTLDLICSLFI